MLYPQLSYSTVAAATARITRNDNGWAMNEVTQPINATEHWTAKDGGVKLFLFEKCAGDPAKSIGTILFVHGSSMASQPTFDLQVPGRPDSSAMDHFARRGYDCWSLDMEGYGRSTKDRNNNAPISQGADDCYAAVLYIQKLRGKRPLLVYGISSGALRAAMFAERHPEMVARPDGEIRSEHRQSEMHTCCLLWASPCQAVPVCASRARPA